MTWFAWIMVGYFAVAAYPTVRKVVLALVASLPRSRSRRGGTLRLDSPGARAVFKQRGEASARYRLTFTNGEELLVRDLVEYREPVVGTRTYVTAYVADGRSIYQSELEKIEHILAGLDVKPRRTFDGLTPRQPDWAKHYEVGDPYP